MDYIKQISELCRVGDYLVQLLAVALKGTEAPAKPADISWEGVFKLAQAHGVELMTFETAQAQVAQEAPQVFQTWELRCMQDLAQGLTQREARQTIAACFAEAGIPLVSLKGAQLARLYPREEYRQMIDLDYLLPPADAARGQSILRELGYECLEEAETDFHQVYHKPPYLTVELHTGLLHNNDRNNRFFSRPWDFVEEDRDGERVLSPSYFFLFMSAHMAKHYFTGGIGIRTVLDVYLFKTLLAERVDWDWVRSGLKKLRLERYMDQVEQIGEVWFGGACRTRRPASQRRMERAIYVAGTHGTRLSRLAGALPERDDLTGVRRAWAMAQFWRRWIFISGDYLRRNYPVLARYPVFYPLCWLHRGVCKGILHRDQTDLTQDSRRLGGGTEC